MERNLLVLHRLFLFPVLMFLNACGAPQEKSPPVVETVKPAKKHIPKNATTERIVMGKFDPATNPEYVKINPSHADKPNMYMHQRAYGDYLKMYGAAKAAGIDLVIRSAARNFDYQKGIWERKWTGETILSSGENASTAYPKPVDRAGKILNYSSMPGTSRHHWGTDIDLNSFENKWFESGEGLKVFNWLEANASKYGFCRPYTSKGPARPHGYNEEKWHWSYMPVAQELTDYAEAHLKDEMITGFQGSEVADTLDVVKHYVLGINNGCRH